MSAPPLCRHIYSLDRRDDYLRQQQAFAAEQPFFSVVRLGRLVLTSAFWNGPTRCCGRWRIFWRRERRLKGATADKVGFNTLESLYNARFDPDKRIITVVALGRGGIPRRL